MNTQSKLQLLKALVEAKRLDTKNSDVRVANKAKGALIGLYRAKRYLEDQVELEQLQNNMFRKVA